MDKTSSAEETTSTETDDGKKSPTPETKKKKKKAKQKKEKEKEKKEEKKLDLSTLVFNIQAEVLQQREQLEENQRKRQGWLDNALKVSQETTAELEKVWSVVNQNASDDDLKEALKKGQKLCDSFLENKQTLINDLQQALKQLNTQHVERLVKNSKKIDQMRELMEEQVKTLTMTHRDKLDKTERVHQHEIKMWLAKDVMEWDKEMKDFWDQELERLAERKRIIEENDEKIRQIKIEGFKRNKGGSKCPKLQKQSTKAAVKVKQTKLNDQLQQLTTCSTKIKKRMICLEKMLREKRAEFIREQENFAKRSIMLSKEYQRYIQTYERLRKQIKHFEITDAKLYEEMYEMIDAFLRQLAARALTIDSVVCKKHLGIPWEQPQLDFLYPTHSAELQKMSASPSPIGQFMERFEEQTLEDSTGLLQDKEPGSTEPPEGSMEEISETPYDLNVVNMKQTEVLELLCDKADFVIEPKIQKVLNSQKEKQTGVKLHLLCDALDIKEEDVPMLANFLLEYEEQHREKLEDIPVLSSEKAEEGETSFTHIPIPDAIHPDRILPALQIFLENYKRHKKSTEDLLAGSKHTQGHINPKDLSNWVKISKIISEERLEVWEAAEITLKQFHEVRTDIFDLVPETDRLEAQNEELRRMLQERCKSCAQT